MSKDHGELIHDETVSAIYSVGHELQAKVEQRIKLYLRPRPRWMPVWVWGRLIRRLLDLHIHPTVVK